MERRGIKPHHNKESALKELKRLTSSGHQVKEVRIVYRLITNFFSLIFIFSFLLLIIINAIIYFS